MALESDEDHRMLDAHEDDELSYYSDEDLSEDEDLEDDPLLMSLADLIDGEGDARGRPLQCRRG